MEISCLSYVIILEYLLHFQSHIHPALEKIHYEILYSTATTKKYTKWYFIQPQLQFTSLPATLESLYVFLPTWLRACTFNIVHVSDTPARTQDLTISKHTLNQRDMSPLDFIIQRLKTCFYSSFFRALGIFLSWFSQRMFC